MSALEELSAALAPPEHGGPPPAEVAAASRQLIERLPRSTQVGVAGALALVVGRSRIGAHVGSGRASRLRGDSVFDSMTSAPITGAGWRAGLDALKTVLMLAHGATAYAGEIEEVANRSVPSRADAGLNLVPGSELPGELEVDVVVVGSGAGGAFAARALARRGLEVLICEEGEHWGVERIRASHPIDRFTGLYRDGGATAAIGLPPVVLPQGRAVGGTTVINSGTCFRPPDGVVADWHGRHGLGFAEPERLAEHLDDVEETLGVGPVPADVMGRNGELAIQGAHAMGWDARPLARNAPDCRGACQCAIGCPNNAKAGVHLNALPQACEAGARIATAISVERILVDQSRATGVQARDESGRRVRIRARDVVVAAGAIHTPLLLRRSGLGSHPWLGRNLSLHPAVGVSGQFEEPVMSWRGVLQSAGVEELHSRHGILIEATSAPPGMTSISLPGYGRPLAEALSTAANSASIGAMIKDQPSGRVWGRRRGIVSYRTARQDQGRLIEAIRAMSRIMLSAGARRVEIGDGTVITDTSQLESAVLRIDFRELHLAAFHPTGTAAAGDDPARHPVDARGQLRGVSGVTVADASILPSCPGVNPQLSIMALADAAGHAAGDGPRASRSTSRRGSRRRPHGRARTRGTRGRPGRPRSSG